MWWEGQSKLRGSAYSHTLYSTKYLGTYGGGGGDDSRRRSRGFGLPLGSEVFLCARNCIEGRRISSSLAPVGSCSGLTEYDAGDLRAAGDACRPSLDVGDALMVMSE
jgi:hypothetical protein